VKNHFACGSVNWCTSTRLPPCCATQPLIRESNPTRSGQESLSRVVGTRAEINFTGPRAR
jgi:hypothetical protein